MKKRMLIIGLIVIIIAAIAIKLSSNKKKLDEQKKPVVANTIAIPVSVVTVAEREASNELIKTGRLIPNREADIMAVSGGKLVAVNFNLGSYVNEGAVVARVDNRALELSLAAAELNKNKAEKDFARFKKLLEGEATTEVSFQDAKLNAENAANQIEQLKKQMADNRIKSPISGQVVSKLVEAGEFVGPGSALGHIVDVSRLKVNVMVSEKDAYTLKLGQEVSVSTDIYPGKEFNGKITFISNQGDNTHNYPVEIALDNPKATPLKAGTFAYVNFKRRSTDKLLMIPRSALLKSIQEPVIYVVEDDKAVSRDITIGGDFGDWIEVLSGLEAGEIVISGGQINVSEGALIQGIPEVAETE